MRQLTITDHLDHRNDGTSGRSIGPDELLTGQLFIDMVLGRGVDIDHVIPSRRLGVDKDAPSLLAVFPHQEFVEKDVH